MAQTEQFEYITSLQAEQALALRLNDPNNNFWSKAELNIYIAEALRMFNGMTQLWSQEWTATYTQPATAPFLPPWQSLGNSQNALVGANPTSPRYQTLTDSFVYTVAQYHMMEPPNGNATWAGTKQFSLADFTQALQRRRDEILQAVGCNVGPFSNSFGIPTGTDRVQIPDSTTLSILDVLRVRFIPLPQYGVPATLWRSDSMAFEYFDNNYEQTSGIPLEWDIVALAPQIIAFDANVNVPNDLDMLCVLSGGLITPPTASPLLIPDDWYWVLKFGMMADLLGKSEESTDLARAAYCEQRYVEGVRLMREMPWLMQARINNVPCDTPTVDVADSFDYEWQSNPNAQSQIVRGGIDLVAVSPTIPDGQQVAVTLRVVANAPVPASDSDYVQVARDVLDALLDEAQHLATFKEGGTEFAGSIELHKNFLRVAIKTNDRLLESGIFETTLRSTVTNQEDTQPRFSTEEK